MVLPVLPRSFTVVWKKINVEINSSFRTRPQIPHEKASKNRVTLEVLYNNKIFRSPKKQVKAYALGHGLQLPPPNKIGSTWIRLREIPFVLGLKWKLSSCSFRTTFEIWQTLWLQSRSMCLIWKFSYINTKHENKIHEIAFWGKELTQEPVIKVYGCIYKSALNQVFLSQKRICRIMFFRKPYHSITDTMVENKTASALEIQELFMKYSKKWKTRATWTYSVIEWVECNQSKNIQMSSIQLHKWYRD